MHNRHTRTTDVVIVGAGLAGLTAADRLARAGHDVLVLEGRDRVGGRIRTAEVAGVPVDTGATWVGPHHTAVHDLARRLDRQLVPQAQAGKGIISSAGKRKVESLTAMPPWVMLDIWRILRALQRLADDMPAAAAWEHPRAEQLDSLSLGEWLTSKHALTGACRFVTMLSLVHWGAPACDVGLLNALRYIKTLGDLDVMLKVEGGDQQDRILGTAHTLASGLAATLGPRVLVNSPVHRIITAADRATVHTDERSIEARYVIVTASPAHRSSIEFIPALPDRHYGLARSWRLGALSKAFAAYDRPFWRDHGLSGEAMSDHETVFLTFDVTADPTGPGILMVFCDARGFDHLDQHTRRDRVITHLTHLYGEGARQPIDYTDFSWGNDTFAAGGPNPAVAPRAWTTFGPFLREPIGLVHWAGTETADATSGTMNGAILSGQRAATEVTARLTDAP